MTQSINNYVNKAYEMDLKTRWVKYSSSDQDIKREHEWRGWNRSG